MLGKLLKNLRKLATQIRNAVEVPKVGDEITFSSGPTPYRAVVTAPASFRQGLEIKYIEPQEKKDQIDYLLNMPLDLKIVKKAPDPSKNYYEFYASNVAENKDPFAPYEWWDVDVYQKPLTDLQKSITELGFYEDQKDIDELADQLIQKGEAVILENEHSSYFVFTKSFQRGMELVEEYIGYYSGEIHQLRRN